MNCMLPVGRKYTVQKSYPAHENNGGLQSIDDTEVKSQPKWHR
jgi:hypothetical protein